MIEYLGQLYLDYPLVVLGTLGVIMAAFIGAVVGTVLSGLIALPPGPAASYRGDWRAQGKPYRRRSTPCNGSWRISATVSAP